jgi:hypothetical protein
MAKVSASGAAASQLANATPDSEPATAPGSVKTTRATRAQSREPQQTQRRSARNVRGASVESETSPAKVVSNAAENGMCKTRTFTYIHLHSLSTTLSLTLTASQPLNTVPHGMLFPYENTVVYMRYLLGSLE